MLCDVEGLTYEEISEILGAKLGTVRSRIHRGRAMLRTALAHRAPADGRARYSGPAAPVARGAQGRHVIGHLGPRVSALLDGQLSAEETERAWAHVHACHACRDLVEREGWVKTRLAGLSSAAGGAPAHLKGSLLGGEALGDAARRAVPGRRGSGHARASHDRAWSRSAAARWGPR